MQHGRQSLGKTVEAVSQGISGIPDSCTFNGIPAALLRVNTFARIDLRCEIDLNVETGAFSFLPDPASVADQEQEILSQVAESLAPCWPADEVDISFGTISLS